MPREYFIDTDRELFVGSETDTTPLTGRELTAGDNRATRIYFLRRTGIIVKPYVYVDEVRRR